MAIRFVRGLGQVVDPSAVNLAASGVIRANNLVDRLLNGTGGAVVGPTASSSTSTMIFGVAQGYVQGASDSYVNVIPVDRSQLWEVDCANIATTAQLGIRHALSASDRGVIHNTATDVGSAAAIATRMTAIFEALYMTSLTTGSGKLVGRFLPDQGPSVGPSQT